jgi:hypothetical protein
MKQETWQDIKDYEDLYKISDKGHVKSLDRYTKTKGGVLKLIKGKTLKPSIDTHGYYKVSLSKFGKVSTQKVHKLVAIAFLGHIPCKQKIVVDHINNNRLDNCVENLQLISQRENTSKDKTEGSSKYTGVRWSVNSSRWLAAIRIEDKLVHLGSFTHELEAHEAYQTRLTKVLSHSIVKSV